MSMPDPHAERRRNAPLSALECRATHRHYPADFNVPRIIPAAFDPALFTLEIFFHAIDTFADRAAHQFLD